jgi:hypothetical protein
MAAPYRPFAFVLMPFSQDYDDIYKFGIKQTCLESDIVAERVDEQQFSETMLERIYRQIENADFIIADMTGKNANVFYEVGFAHAKEKLCILLTQKAGDIPFDLKHHTHVIYDGSAGDLANKLRPWLTWAKVETEKRKSETISVSVRAENASLKKTDWKHLGSCDLVIDLRNRSGRRSPEIEAIYVNLKKTWSASAHGKDLPFESDEKVEMKRFLISPSIRRLSPNAFLQERFTISRDFWTKWSGQQVKDVYTSTGKVRVEVVTSEGTLSYEIPVDASFEEFPF